ncbi:MAG TPA: tRNA (adenosine(37)-N6)-dimethylallyltransferase MiaA [Spirochaetota bacterium]|nr:tRNA (adenosine(37)-N6)-dimethylallyltransferase MiaA [Spirochaetota bacterium]HOD13860.1 tRNA (adenosine(37)-N6)-dimethylallyltransferase MiaA [Spirochaetota bacterium]HQL80951.1 tRNA (adenosine(37)-N6)-dimethylallyltransferase MiaA [Spirochaetota bacterium]
MTAGGREHSRHLVLMGPTAVGKTAAALELAGDRFEIVSADSVQVYKYLDVGSGKPERADRDRIPHHLIDIVEPDVSFTAGEFCREAEKAINLIAAHSRLPMIVGGAGLYIDAYFQGLSEIPEIAPGVREAIRVELEDGGLQRLHDELVLVDPAFGNRIHPNDTQRILRGLEVYRATGRPLSSYYAAKRRYGSEDTLFIGLYEERADLRKRINARVDSMFGRGFVEEVRSLRERGYGPDLNSMQSIGYAEINRYIDGAVGLDETIQRIKTATGQYAKRQMTWFRKNERVVWVRAGDMENMRLLIQQWLDGSEA